MVSTWGVCLKLLRVGNTCLLSPSLPVLVRLFPRVTLVFISISTSSIVPTYSILVGYVHKFWLSSLLTCMGSVLAYSIAGGYVHKFCIINFFFLTCMESMPAYSILRGYVHKFCILLFRLVWDLCLHV